jgi:type IV pilus biogenesis protein CpaD/CtpE
MNMDLAFASLGKRALTGSLIALASLSAGCTPEYISRSFVRAETVASPSDVQQQLYFQPGSSQLVSGEAARLQQRLRSLLLRPDDDVVISLATTGSDVLDAQRAATMRHAVGSTPARVRFLAQAGFSVPEAYPDVALVQVLRYGRVLVLCPASNGDFTDDRFGWDRLMLGCQNAVNIANQANDARDLTAPNQLSPVGGAAADIAAVERFRAGKVTNPNMVALP